MEVMLEQKLNEIRNLCEGHFVTNLSVFGSSIHAGFNKDSDYDFLVCFNDSLPLSSYAKNFFSLQRQLETLLNRKVDLVTESSLTNPVFIDQIKRSQISIYDFKAA